jgi:hypothetical protein
MCSYDYSGGVIVDHADNPVFVGMTVAHEMGHNFGFELVHYFNNIQSKIKEWTMMWNNAIVQLIPALWRLPVASKFINFIKSPDN